MLCNRENIQPVITRRGYFDSQNLLVLKSDEALQLMSKPKNVEQSTFSVEKTRLEETALKFESRRSQKNLGSLKYELNALEYHVKVYSEPSVIPLSLHLRREEECKITASRKEYFYRPILLLF